MSASPQSTTSSAVILDAERIQRCVQRIARQILEDHHQAARIVVTAIDGQGTVLGERIAAELMSIEAPETHSCILRMNKDAPLDHEMSLLDTAGNPFDMKTMEEAVVIVVDDVLNSGRTLLYGIAHILPARPRHVGACVLVDRIHRRFPVRADYVGQSLSTNLKAHISVELSGPGPDVALLKD